MSGDKTKNFSKTKNPLRLPYLLDIQKENWNWFWEVGIKELFSEISPIRDYTKKELELWFTDHRVDAPKYKTDLEEIEREVIAPDYDALQLEGGDV